MDGREDDPVEPFGGFRLFFLGIYVFGGYRVLSKSSVTFGGIFLPLKLVKLHDPTWTSQGG